MNLGYNDGWLGGTQGVITRLRLRWSSEPSGN